MKLDLSQAQIKTILRALAVCSADAQDNRDNCNGEQIRDYYERKRREYDECYTAVHDAVEDPFWCSTDRAIDIAETALEPYRK